jgi:hypothetical protein
VSGATLDPADGQRFLRLRSLLVDARRRVEDESELGSTSRRPRSTKWGSWESGCAIEHRGFQPKPKVGLPGRCTQLLESLDLKPPGTKAFGELHRMRNLVKHAGVLPSAEQLPRWLSETEALIDALVSATFGLGLSEVSASDGVKDEQLRGKLEDSEHILEEGDAEGSFAETLAGIGSARQSFSREAGFSMNRTQQELPEPSRQRPEPRPALPGRLSAGRSDRAVGFHC